MGELNHLPNETTRLVPQGVAASKAVRLAVADVMSKLEPLQARVAFLAAKGGRVRGAVDRKAMEAECQEIEAVVGEVRTELILRLMDAPPLIAGHSRILDIEKALDSIERSVKQTRGVFTNGSQASGRAS